MEAPSEGHAGILEALAHVGSWELDLATQQLIFSDEHYRIFGLEPGGCMQREDVARAIHPDDRAASRQAFEQAIRERASSSLEMRILRPDGSLRWIHNRCAFVADAEGGPGRMVGTTQDITERVQSNRQHAQLGAHINSLLSATSEGIYGLSLDGRCTFMNAAGAALLGYAPAELIGQPMHALVHNRHADGTPYRIETCPLHQAMRSGVACRLDTDVLWRRDGSALAVEFTANPLLENQQVTGLVVAFQDLSARKRADANMRESEERLQLALQIAGLGTFDWDIPHDHVVWSAAVERMFGVEPGAFGGTLAAFQAFVHEDDLPAVGRAIADSLERGLKFTAEFRFRRVDGDERWMATSGQVYRDPHGQPVRLLGVARDVTERKHAEQQREALHRSEKLRALGQMASGIAHDLNQSLMLVASYSDLARTALVQDPPDLAEVEDLMATTTQAAMDGGETVKRLLLFTRAAPEQDSTCVDLSEVVRDAAQLTAPRWRDATQAEGRPISLHIEARDRPTIQGSNAQLRELMTNLIFNAVDALPTGGTIHLRVVSEDGHGIIDVGDSGVGMSAAVQKRVFEPFFTTKGEGGTGLGLAMVFGIVQQHGGDIEVRSTPGNGTIFRITFPLVDALVPASRRQPSSGPLEPQRPLRVLLVDDEPMMTRAVARMLKPSGHLVSVAASGEQAIERLNEQAFDVVVSDVGMGAGMNGWELADAVKGGWPETRFLLATGWGAAMDPREARLRGIEAVLSKPYRLDDLVRTLACTDRAA